MPERIMKIFIIAGEASGDALGASFMYAFKKLYPNVEFTGVGGKLMSDAGIRSIFPMEELSIMGIAEVLPKLKTLLSRINQTAASISTVQPDAVLTIDSPDFCFRVIKKLKKKNRTIPCVHYVAPSVWAWRKGRAKKVAKFLDHILTLLPFEPPYFEEHSLAATFVGHPIVEKDCLTFDTAHFKQKHKIKDTQRIISFLPGSRHGELNKLIPIFHDVILNILKEVPNAAIVIPTLPHLRLRLHAELSDIKSLIITDDYNDKFAAFAASEIAVAASGTVSLELALTKTPHIITYQVNKISAFIGKLLISTKFVNLINIILGYEIVPELLQQKCRADIITAEALSLLRSPEKQQQQKDAFILALSKIGLGDKQKPSEKAARAVLNVILNKQNSVVR